MLGNISLEIDYVLDIEPYLDEKMMYGPTESLDIVVGSTANLYVKYLKQDSDITLRVTPSNPNVVVCTDVKSGTDRNVIELTGRSPGVTNITIDITNKDGSTVGRDLKVIVLPNTVEYISPHDIFFRKSVVCVLPGDKIKLDYTVLPREAMAMAVYWISSDENVATVDQNGNVTANGLGDCRIMIYNQRLGLTYYCEFYVVESTTYPQKILWRSSPPESIQVGEEIRLPNYVLASFGGSPNIVTQDGYWTSSNPSVLAISEYGTMVGKGIGEATITFRTPQNSNLTSARAIKVIAPQIPIQNIELDVYEATLNEISSQGSLQINYKVFPVNTSESEVVWTTSNMDLVTVDSDGLVEVRKIVDTVQTVTIRCASVLRPSVFKECIITLDPNEPYPFVVKTFTPRVTTVVNRLVNIDYEVDICFSYASEYRFNYVTSVTMESGTPAQEGTYSIEHKEGSSIRFSASVKGRYKITLACNFTRDSLSYNNTVTFGRAYFYVEVGEESSELTFLENLQTVSALANGGYILRFFVRDNRDGAASFELDLGTGWKPVLVNDYMYQGKMYNYIFGEGLPIGSHLARVRATNITSGESVTSNVTTVFIPETSSDKKSALFEAKSSYDYAEYDIITYLETIITDSRLYDEEELEFRTRYKTYCHNYYNLREILEVCVAHINEQIAASQGQMAALSNTLSYDVSIASCSANNSTNSNYQNVTDMDYYQNECIKQLMARVLELETKLSELANNNK